MKIDLQCPIALRSPNDVVFGTALWLDGDRIGVRTDATVPTGQDCEFRLELNGRQNTIYGTARIEIPQDSGARPGLLTATLVHLPSEERQKLKTWVRAQGPEPTHASFSAPSHTSPTRDDALDWLNPTPSTGSWPSPPADKAASPEATPTARRPAAAEPAPEPKPEPEPAPAPVASPPPGPPEYQVDFGRNTVTVSWPDRRAFRHSWDQQIKLRSLEVPANPTQLPYLHQPFNVILEPPLGRPVTLRAGVLVRQDASFTLGLELTAYLVSQLESLAGPPLETEHQGSPTTAPPLCAADHDPRQPPERQPRSRHRRH